MSLHTSLCAWDNLWLAYRNASRGKRGKHATAAFEVLLADHLITLQEQLRNRSYQPGPYNSFYIHEPKRRLISAAPFRDRVVHHALCNVTVPRFERLFIADSYANRVGKGTHRALDRCQQFTRRFRYVLQCDIVQFFPSIDHDILRNILFSMLAEESLNWLIDRVLGSGRGVLAEEYNMVYFPGDDIFAVQRPRGLPIGNLTSQWWANCYLNPFDHFVRRELGCRAYIRYVDDFILFSQSKRELWEWIEAIVKRLERYRLVMHSKGVHPKPVTEGIPFLGFIIYPEKRRLKRRKGIAYRRHLKKLLKTATHEQVKSSLCGWLNYVRYGDTYGLRTKLLADFDLLVQEDEYA
jgi:retron-type reverse transcriptase